MRIRKRSIQAHVKRDLPIAFSVLVEEALDFAIKVPLWKWLGLREKIAARRRWSRVDGSVSGFETILHIPSVLRHNLVRCFEGPYLNTFVGGGLVP